VEPPQLLMRSQSMPQMGDQDYPMLEISTSSVRRRKRRRKNQGR
jgi:hypothetical protein